MHPYFIRSAVSLAVASCAAFSVGCGGGGGDQNAAETATGYFKDAAVTGMHYVSGGQRGETGTGGRFVYELGKPVVFSIGSLEIGTITLDVSSGALITPLDMVSGATSSHGAVQNRVRLLMALDSDGDAANGITLSAAMRAAAADWPTLNFNTGAELFEADGAVGQVLTESKATEAGSTGVLPTATAAQEHLEATLRCAYSGAFTGTYDGDDQGRFAIMINPVDRNATGFVYSALNTVGGPLSAGAAVGYTQNHLFDTRAGGDFDNASYQGSFKSGDHFTGGWESDEGQGTLVGDRIGGLPEADYRLTGTFDNGAGVNGVIAVDVNGTTATGVWYDLTGEQTVTFTGTATVGATIEISATDPVTLTGSYDPATGGFTGTWDSVAFSGGGCRLN